MPQKKTHGVREEQEMSLSGLLKGCGERERAFQEILRSFHPAIRHFPKNIN